MNKEIEQKKKILGFLLMLTAFLPLTVSKTAFAQASPAQGIDAYMMPIYESTLTGKLQKPPDNPFFQYKQDTRPNTLFITKYDLCRNMDDRIKHITYENGITSYMFTGKKLGYEGLISSYHAQYLQHCTKGQRALRARHKEREAYIALLDQYPNLYRYANRYYVSLLTEPFQNRALLRQQFLDTSANPSRIHTQPIVPGPNPYQAIESRIENEENTLSKVPEYPEKPSKIPIYQLPYNKNATVLSDSLNHTASNNNESKSMQQKTYDSKPGHQSPIQLLYGEAIKAFEKRNYPKAKTLFDRILALNPDSPQTLFAHGLSTFYSGDYQQSLQDFKKCGDKSPSNNFPLHSRDFQYHLKKLDKHVKLNPNDRVATDLQTRLNIFSRKLEHEENE